MSKSDLLPLIKATAHQSIKNHQLLPAKVSHFTKAFSRLPRAQAIEALSLYSKLLRREINQATLSIESATPLSKAQVDQLKHHFGKTHQISSVKASVNPSLLAGIRVKIGDDVYEDTIHSRLDQLKQHLIT